MELSNHETHVLLELLAQKVGESIDGYAWQLIESATEGPNQVSKRFLTDKSRDVKDGKDPIPFQNVKLQSLLQLLGFDSPRQFLEHLEKPIDEVLLGCTGTWISLVRQNSFDGILYQSPVRIYQNSQSIRFELRGPAYAYGGDMSYRNGCLTVLFSGASGKQFHHVYKIGNRKNPKVLQGIYSGISTGDDPIGGRCVLYRTEEELENIPNQRLHVEVLQKSENHKEQAIGNYFEEFNRNNLRLNPIIAFDLEDLRNAW